MAATQGDEKRLPYHAPVLHDVGSLADVTKLGLGAPSLDSVYGQGPTSFS